MKVIAVGNCLPNGEPGLLVAATQEEIDSSYIKNFLYSDIEIWYEGTVKSYIGDEKISSVVSLYNSLQDAMKSSNKRSLKLKEIDEISNKEIKAIEKEYPDYKPEEEDEKNEKDE